MKIYSIILLLLSFTPLSWGADTLFPFLRDHKLGSTVPVGDEGINELPGLNVSGQQFSAYRELDGGKSIRSVGLYLRRNTSDVPAAEIQKVFAEITRVISAECGAADLFEVPNFEGATERTHSMRAWKNGTSILVLQKTESPGRLEVDVRHVELDDFTSNLGADFGSFVLEQLETKSGVLSIPASAPSPRESEADDSPVGKDQETGIEAVRKPDLAGGAEPPQPEATLQNEESGTATWPLVIRAIAVQVFKSCSSRHNIAAEARKSNEIVPWAAGGEKVVDANAPPDREPGSGNQAGNRMIYNEGSPDSEMNPLNQKSAYYLSDSPTSRILLKNVVENNEREFEIEKSSDIQPSKKFQLKRGGVLGKQLYDADGRFLRCLPLSINVERGVNPNAAEHCADNIQWNWLDDQRLIGVQPIDLKGAPDPFGGRESKVEHTVPMPSFSRIYVIDIRNMDKIYEVGPLPPLPPYFAVELTGITKGGLISLQAVNHIQDGVPNSEKRKKSGFFRVDATPE